MCVCVFFLILAFSYTAFMEKTISLNIYIVMHTLISEMLKCEKYIHPRVKKI